MDQIIGAIIKRTGKDPDAIEVEHPISREDADLLMAIDAGELDEVWRAGAARERDALRLACQMLITDGADLARLVDRARATLGADVDPALLAWARCVVAARGTIDGAER